MNKSEVLTGKQMRWRVGRVAAMAAIFVLPILEIYEPRSAFSFLLGIVFWLLPNFYFSVKVFQHVGVASAKCLLKKFYKAERNKLVLSGIFFVVMIKFLPVNIPLFLAGYCVTQLLFFVWEGLR